VGGEPIPADTNMSQFEYDVYFSFAGEDRAYVEEVADLIKEKSVRVFYDKYERSKLWGKDLYTYLDEVYRKRTQYCVIFISKYYAKKLWTNHERQSAQARAFTENEEYLLPVRFDDTEIPGKAYPCASGTTISGGEKRRLILEHIANMSLSGDPSCLIFRTP
jgi:hypothetical protein